MHVQRVARRGLPAQAATIPGRVLALALLLLPALGGCAGGESPEGPSGEAGVGGAADAGSGGAGGSARASAGAQAPGGGAPTASGGAAGAALPGDDAGAGGVSVAGAAGAAAPGHAASAGSAVVAECGNALKEPGEQCDADDLGGADCVDVGFERGSLRCGADCRLVLTDCAGSERCSDGQDNDGDRLVDCDDDDCLTECSDPCADVLLIDDGGAITGLLAGHGGGAQSACARSSESPKLVFSFTSPRAGLLSAVATADETLIVSARDECRSTAAELGCSAAAGLEVPVEAGQLLYLMVEGTESTSVGYFELSAEVIGVGCGNAIREPGEECDDGNLEDGDGCSLECAVETSEREPNGRINRANDYTAPFYGAISSSNDRDYVRLELAEPPASLDAWTTDFGDGACASGELDSSLELIAPDRSTVLAADDDGGAGYCSRVHVADVEAGVYYLSLTPSEYGDSFDFAYLLQVDVSYCGNGIVSTGEECDDSNRASGDGCSSSCVKEW